MHVITARNVHQALPLGIRYLKTKGVRRESRNGPVLVAPGPVTTEYLRPTERLVFWPERDINTAFLLYEALWMLRGRDDLAPLTRYIKDFGRYSDNGLSLHGAYGHRWRVAFGFDQLALIAKRLTQDIDDRRSVLQIWDAKLDLDRASKDLPCNDTVTFQRNDKGELDMVVFNRSNDIIWGAYFANAVHFSVLQEYLACWIGCPVGRYWQVSTNYHAFLSTLIPLMQMPEEHLDSVWSVPAPIVDPYRDGAVAPLLMGGEATGQEVIEYLDARISEVMLHAATGFELPRASNDDDPWVEMLWTVLRAHDAWRNKRDAGQVIARGDLRVDFVQSMAQWVARREAVARV